MFFLVTNQPGVAEGLLTLEQVERVNTRVVSVLAEAGLTITATYVCPHRRGDGCHCIKPNPHFLHQAAEQHGIELRRSFVVGDHPHDVELAKRAGAQGVYVCMGHGWKHIGDLAEAAANMFAALRRLDALGLDLIVARPVPENGVGATIMDRLRKASSPPQRASH